MTGRGSGTREAAGAAAVVGDWLDRPEPARFPYDPVVGAYLRVGKHFVGDDLLTALQAARRVTADRPDRGPGMVLLDRFLATALDKRDGRYDYPSYIALALLPMPRVDDPPELVPYALARRDRLVVHLLADAVGFELTAAAGGAGLLPEMRPPASTVTKRYRLAHRVAAPALRRLGLAGAVTATEPEPVARELCAAVAPELSALDRRVAQLSMLPVYVAHDEWLFIRVLQMFETTFAMMAAQLRHAVYALTFDDCASAARCVDTAEIALRESAPLFSLLATMQVAAFQVFRQYTEGASAIQSRSYKIVESLCRRPDADRLASAAYLSVPEVRDRVLAGQATLDEVLVAVRSTRRPEPAALDELTAAMERFAATLLRWRNTHHRLAVHMLGDRSGTGYTEGPPYLRAVRDIPVFRSVSRSDQPAGEGLAVAGVPAGPGDAGGVPPGGDAMR